MINRIMRWLRGTARVSVMGDTERFIKLLVRSGIRPMELLPREGGMELLIHARQFGRLHAVKLRTHSRVRLIERSGLPLIMRAVGKRPGISGGILLGMAVYVWLSGFYWCVDIAGAASYSKTEILKTAAENGVYIGAKRSEVDLPTAANGFIRALPELSWASFNSDGCAVTLEFKAAEEKAEGVPADGVCDVVAAREGLVKKIAAQSGTVLVKVGSAVKRGQILVSGITVIGNPWDPNDEVRHLLSHARAQVIAETRHTFTASCPMRFEAERERRSGTRKMLYILGLRLPLSLVGVSGEELSTVRRDSLTLLGTELPVRIETQSCGVLEKTTVELTREEAQVRAIRRARALRKNYLGEDGVLLSEEIEVWESDGVIYASAHCVIEENIAREAALNGD